MTAARKRAPSSPPALRLVGGEATIGDVGAKRAKRNATGPRIVVRGRPEPLRDGDGIPLEDTLDADDFRALADRLLPWEAAELGEFLRPLDSAVTKARREHEREPTAERRALALALEALWFSGRDGDAVRRRAFLDTIAAATESYLEHRDATSPRTRLGRRRPIVVDDRPSARSKARVLGREEAVRALLAAADLAVRIPLGFPIRTIRRGEDEPMMRGGMAARTVIPEAAALARPPADAVPKLAARIAGHLRAKREIRPRMLATWALEACGVTRSNANNWIRSAFTSDAR